MIASLFDPWARQEGVEPRLRALHVGTDQISGADDGLGPFLLAAGGGGAAAVAALPPAASAGAGANAASTASPQPRPWLHMATGTVLAAGSGGGSQGGSGSGGASPGGGSDGSPPRPSRDQHSRRPHHSPPAGGAKAATLPHVGPDSPPPAGLGATRAHSGAAATGSPTLHHAPQRPPLPPSFSLLTSVGSGGGGYGPAAAPLDALHVSPGGPRDLSTCRSLCSSLGTCSDDDQQPPSSGAPTPMPSGPTLGLDAALLGAASARSLSFGSGGCCAARRASLLGDLGRASSCTRRASSADGLGGLLAAACSSDIGAGACAGSGGGPPSPCPCGAGTAPATPPPALLRRSLPEGRAYTPAGVSGTASPPLLATPQLTPAPSDDIAPWWGARWSWGSYSDQNGRQHMEDRLAAADVSGHEAFAGHRRAGFFAVFDGHAGAEAAEHLADHLLRYLLESPPDQLATEPAAALGAAVERAEAEIIRSLSAAACNAGSTLLAALLLDDKLHVANVGDCRAVLARGTEALQITTDHKPHAESEAARIARDHAAGRAALAAALADAAAAAAAAAAGELGSGGADAEAPSDSGSSDSGAAERAADDDAATTAAAAAVEQTRAGSCSCGGSGGAAVQSDGAGSSPIVTSDGYLYGELAVARALGSQHLKRDPTKRGFTHVPDLFSVQLAREDDLLLLASDGLWDKVENSDAVASARRCYARDRDPSSAARVLVDRAVRFNSTDNISVVVVALHDRGIALPKTNSRLFLRPPSAASSHGGGAVGTTGGCTGGGSAGASPDCVGSSGCGGGGLASAAGSAAATPAQSRPATPGSFGSPPGSAAAPWAAAGSPAGPGRLLF